MSTCLKCGGMLRNRICAACGHDPSRDYSRFPTFAMLPVWPRTSGEPKHEPHRRPEIRRHPGRHGRQ